MTRELSLSTAPCSTLPPPPLLPPPPPLPPMAAAAPVRLPTVRPRALHSFHFFCSHCDRFAPASQAFAFSTPSRGGAATETSYALGPSRSPKSCCSEHHPEPRAVCVASFVPSSLRILPDAAAQARESIFSTLRNRWERATVRPEFFLASRVSALAHAGTRAAHGGAAGRQVLLRAERCESMLHRTFNRLSVSLCLCRSCCPLS